MHTVLLRASSGDWRIVDHVDCVVSRAVGHSRVLWDSLRSELQEESPCLIEAVLSRCHWFGLRKRCSEPIRQMAALLLRGDRHSEKPIPLFKHLPLVRRPYSLSADWLDGCVVRSIVSAEICHRHHRRRFVAARIVVLQFVGNLVTPFPAPLDFAPRLLRELSCPLLCFLVESRFFHHGVNRSEPLVNPVTRSPLTPLKMVGTSIPRRRA